jgi:hypothetical protein
MIFSLKKKCFVLGNDSSHILILPAATPLIFFPRFRQQHIMAADLGEQGYYDLHFWEGFNGIYCGRRPSGSDEVVWVWLAELD